MKSGPSPAFAAALGVSVFLSGAAALIYQVAWQRILLLHAGVGVYSVALITAAFLAGLGVGSRIAAETSTRVGPAAALRVFGALELAVAAFAAASPWLYYELLYERGLWLASRSWSTGLVHFAALAVPTTLMGMSLPFVVRAVVRSVESAPRSVGWLYGINVLGASSGALATPWLLIRFLGVTGAIHAGVAANAAAGLLALLVPAPRETQASEASEATTVEAGPERRQPFGLWLLLYALTGFTALGLEVVWFRLLEIGVKGTAFTFGTLLALFLGGLGAGSLIATRRLAQLRDPLRGFLAAQCGLLLWACAAVALAVHLPAELPGLSTLTAYWGERRGIVLGWEWDPALLATLYLAWPAWLFAVPTLLMGVSFVLLQRAVQDDPLTSGRKVGLLQAANIAGNVLGSLVVGLVALDHLGSAGTLRAFAWLGVAWAVAGAASPGRRAPFLVLGAALVATALAMPTQEALWRRLHGADAHPAFVDEDATAVIAVTEPEESRWWIWMSGRSQSSLPFGGVHTRLGALPALVHPRPRRAAIIGLGSGDTAWAAGCRPETELVRVFELSAPQRRLLERVSPGPGLGRLRRFLEDPRVELILEDGRNHIQRSQERYDLIEADALLPYAAGSGSVYSLEFFQAMGARLAPGGLMTTWRPTRRVAVGFAEVFPFVLALDDGAILIGSREPLRLEPDVWIERLQGEPGRYLGVRLRGQVERSLAAARWLTEGDTLPVAPNTDLSPRDEFSSPLTP